MFGTSSPKRTTLWGNTGGLRLFENNGLSRAQLRRSAKRHLVRRFVDKDGIKRFSGKARELKSSQTWSYFTHALKMHRPPRKFRNLRTQALSSRLCSSSGPSPARSSRGEGASLPSRGRNPGFVSQCLVLFLHASTPIPGFAGRGPKD